MQFECKECGKAFDTQRGLHMHIKKHDMLLGDYYVKNYPRFDKLTEKPIEFKNASQYFSRDFNTTRNMNLWFEKAPKDEVKKYILEKFKKRLKKKDLKHAPSSLYLKTGDWPTLDVIKKLFGGYNAFCGQIGVTPAYGDNICKEFFEDYSDQEVWIDTRENKPLNFKNPYVFKLDFGDYTLPPKNYTHTHAERKSFQDFAATVTNGYARFIREIERCQSLGCFLFIVVEADYNKIYKTNSAAYKKFNMGFVFSRMRSIEAQFSDCCQFVFSGSRKDSEALIPKILCCGKKLWNVDLQYFWEKELEKNGLDRRQPEPVQEVQRSKPRSTFQRRLHRRRRS